MESNQFITPYLPKILPMELPAWVKAGNPAFFKVIPQPNRDGLCRNCAGVGVIYINLCQPKNHNTPPMMTKPSTFFEGSDKFYQGWYVIDRTLEIDCPHCKGKEI